MKNNDSVTIRLNVELLDWLKDKAKDKDTNISNIIKEAILIYQELDQIPQDMKFNKLMQIYSDKASILTYRLLQVFIEMENGKSAEILTKAHQLTKSDLDKYRV